MKTLKNEKKNEIKLKAMGAKGMGTFENQLLGKAIQFSESFEGL